MSCQLFYLIPRAILYSKFNCSDLKIFVSCYLFIIMSSLKGHSCLKYIRCFLQFDTIWTIQKTWKTPRLTLLKVILLHGCFSRFLSCTNGTKSRKISHLKSRSFVILAFGNYSNLIRISLNIPKSSVIWTSYVCVLVLYLISWKNEYISTFNIFFCHFFSFFVVWKASLNYIWPFDRRQFSTSVFTKLLF